jgi:3-phenylpropionate/trans-cinnamate dioxygenase ferredoxin subunit
MTGTVVCRLADLAPGTATRVVVDGRPVAVVRIGDDVYAIGTASRRGVTRRARCTPDERHRVPHGSTFSLVTGEPQTLPATRPVPVYDVAVVDGDIVVTVP